MHNTFGPFTCKGLDKWIHLTWHGHKQQCPKWGSFEMPKMIYLGTQLEKTGFRIRQIEWKTYFQQHLEASIRNFERKNVSIQEVNKRIFATIAALKNTSETLSLSPPTAPHSSSVSACSLSSCTFLRQRFLEFHNAHISFSLKRGKYMNLEQKEQMEGLQHENEITEIIKIQIHKFFSELKLMNDTNWFIASFARPFTILIFHWHW